MVRNKIHPTTVITGYRYVYAALCSVSAIAASANRRWVETGADIRDVFVVFSLACKEACRFMAEQLSTKVDKLGRDCIVNVAKTSMSSKILSS